MYGTSYYFSIKLKYIFVKIIYENPILWLQNTHCFKN